MNRIPEATATPAPQKRDGSALGLANLLTYGRIAAVPAVAACLFGYAVLDGGLWLRWVALDHSGYIIGGQIGYNYQLVSGMVFGVETDLQVSGMNATAAGGRFDTDYLGTIRGRLGYAFNSVMIYGTAGLAYAGGDLTVAGLSNDQTHWGYAVGVGLEAMLTGNWSAKLEYLYTDFSRENYVSVAGPAGIRFNANILRVGVNYRF